MSRSLAIAANFGLPIEAVTLTQAILARRGAGKSYTASVIAEEMLAAGQQIVAIDPTGAWWGLRAGADGDRGGFPIAVLGGEHGDVPLEEHAGETVARAIVEERFSAVLDLSLFRKGQVTRFMTAFLETLYRLNREAIHLFIDEADAVAPQRPFGDEARMLGAAEDVVRRGRRRGIGCTLITQRPQVLNKNVLTQCEILTTLRLGHPKDIAAVREWIEVHAEAAEAREMMASLPALPVGTAWVWSPALGIFERVQVRKRRTFDSGATPKPGQRAKAPKVLAEVDVAKLGKAIAETAQRAKDNDPKALRAEVERLRRRVAELEAAPAKSERVEVPVLLAAEVAEIGDLIKRMEEAASRVTLQAAALKHEVAKAAAPAIVAAPSPRLRAIGEVSAAAAPQRRAPVGRTGNGEVGNGGLRRMLVALAQRPQGLSAGQVGIRAQLSSKSGTFDTYLARGKSHGWITGTRGRLTITDAGIEALGHFDPLPCGRDLLSHYLRELGSSGVARMLQVVADAYPGSVSRSDLAERAGLTGNSGTFDTYLARLRSLELIEGRGELRMSEELAS